MFLVLNILLNIFDSQPMIHRNSLFYSHPENVKRKFHFFNRKLIQLTIILDNHNNFRKCKQNLKIEIEKLALTQDEIIYCNYFP